MHVHEYLVSACFHVFAPIPRAPSSLPVNSYNIVLEFVVVLSAIVLVAVEVFGWLHSFLTLAHFELLTLFTKSMLNSMQS